jgi:hypothetical protein
MLEGGTPEEDPGPDAYHKLGDVEAGPCACLFFFSSLGPDFSLPSFLPH